MRSDKPTPAADAPMSEQELLDDGTPGALGTYMREMEERHLDALADISGLVERLEKQATDRARPEFGNYYSPSNYLEWEASAALQALAARVGELEELRGTENVLAEGHIADAIRQRDAALARVEELEREIAEMKAKDWDLENDMLLRRVECLRAALEKIAAGSTAYENAWQRDIARTALKE